MMSAPKVYVGSDVTLEVVGVTTERVSFEVFAQAIFDAHPLPPVGQLSAFITPPPGHDDPLLPVVMRFVAARPGGIGAGALMRRFGLGRRRATRLLEVLRAQRVCLGAPWCGVYRVNHAAWASLPVPTAVNRARWASGLAGELAKFAEFCHLDRIQHHVWFIESLLTRVQAMGLNAAEVAPYRRQLIECAGAARRRLLPRWREAAARFGAEFFGVGDGVYPVSMTIEVVE